MKRQKAGNIFRALMGGMMIGCIILFYALVWPSMAAEKPQYGGILNMGFTFNPRTYDPHQSGSVSVIQPVAPHYSLLLKLDPENYPKIIGDLAESWTVSRDSKTYTFKIHKGVKFHDGSILTARDVKATYDKIIFPPSGVISDREALYSVVEKVEAPDAYTIVFRLKWPAASFLSSLASPFNVIYKADILAKDMHWYEKNVMGSGPFKFVEHVAGSHWLGKRNEDYFVKGRPYLDGFRLTIIPDQAARVAAIRAGRVHGDFLYLPPSTRDDLVRAMGDKIKVQEVASIAFQFININCSKKPFDDPRVRRALNLALDRWEGSKSVSQISSLKYVGGMFRPGSEFAMTDEELMKITGFSKDINTSRKEARRLLREAGVPDGFSFKLKNWSSNKDYEVAAIWAIDQWRQIGLNVTQVVAEAGTSVVDQRAGNFQLYVDAISDFADDPGLQYLQFLSSDKSSINHQRYTDRVLDDLYDKQSQTMDPAERKKLSRQFEIRALDEMAYLIPILWRTRIVLHSPQVKGWKALPSQHLDRDLANTWLSKD